MSFVWRTGAMGLAAFITIILDNLNMLELSPISTTLLGLVLGEISKYLNTHSV